MFDVQFPHSQQIKFKGEKLTCRGDLGQEGKSSNREDKEKKFNRLQSPESSVVGGH